jgi:hypothetical protein
MIRLWHFINVVALQLSTGALTILTSRGTTGSSCANFFVDYAMGMRLKTEDSQSHKY